VTVALWVITLADSEREFGIATKITAILIFMAATFAMVRSRADYRAGVVGLLMGVSTIGILGLLSGIDVGAETFNPLRSVGNKNAFSLMGLPALLLGIELALRAKTPFITRIMAVMGCGTVAVVTFASANRSGWLSTAFIAVMVLSVSGLGVRKIATMALVGGGVYLVLADVFGAGVFERRYEQTLEGYSSDTLRIELLKGCFWSGVDHPIFGAGPGTLPRELASYCSHVVDAEVLSPHNAITYIFGLGGVLLVVSFVWLAWALLRLGQPVGTQPPVIRMVLALWVVRGFFSDEVLFAPAFAFALGLAIAEQVLAMAEKSQAQRSRATEKHLPMGRPVRLGGPRLTASRSPAH
jgi:hypothetical protein